MAFKSKDGKRSFGNRQQAQAYDSRGEKEAHKQAQPSEEPVEPVSDEQEESPMDIHEHVAEHGPAEKVEIQHSEGKHTKTSHHGGAKHVSHHESAEEAHHHGMIAAGVQPQEQQQQMQPMQQEAGAIPGM